jgi:hypothetical protein
MNKSAPARPKSRIHSSIIVETLKHRVSSGLNGTEHFVVRLQVAASGSIILRWADLENNCSSAVERCA